MEQNVSVNLGRPAFFEAFNWQAGFDQILDNIPKISFWIKNASGQFVMTNRMFAKLCCQKSPEALIGKTDKDIWPQHLAEGYTNDDELVIRTGRNIINQVELIRTPDGSKTWFSTTKLPAKNKDGRIIGIVGFTFDLVKADDNIKPVLKMAPVIDYIIDHYSDTVEVKALAVLLGLSVSAFERKFKKQFGQTPIQYISKVRMNAACQLLVAGSDSMSAIAIKTGFYDSSHFVRQFRKHMGESPREYRTRFNGVLSEELFRNPV